MYIEIAKGGHASFLVMVAYRNRDPQGRLA